MPWYDQWTPVEKAEFPSPFSGKGIELSAVWFKLFPFFPDFSYEWVPLSSYLWESSHTDPPHEFMQKTTSSDSFQGNRNIGVPWVKKTDLHLQFSLIKSYWSWKIKVVKQVFNLQRTVECLPSFWLCNFTNQTSFRRAILKPRSRIVFYFVFMNFNCQFMCTKTNVHKWEQPFTL
jgi:hypothetical protein